MALVEAQQTTDYENISNLMKSVLKKYGLTDNELKVYDHLIKNGPLHANQIGKNLNIYRTEIYRLLNSLQNKKIVDLINDKPSKFVGIDYAKALDHLINTQIGRLNELRLVRNSLSK